MNSSAPMVYIVDDDNGMRTSLAWLLDSVGVKSEGFANAADFLRAFDVSRPACLVLDVRMPEASGFDVQAELNRRGATLPIIFVSGHGDIPMSVRALQHGAIDFVEKPYNSQQMLDRVQRAMKLAMQRHAKDQRQRELRERVDSLTGREKDLIIRSAHNIDPSAIEEVANSHPDVNLGAAVGMPDVYAGEVPVVFVEPRAGASLDPDAVLAYISERIHEPPARPKKVFVIPKIPRTGVGKIFKPTLREFTIRQKIADVLAALDSKQDAEITANATSSKRPTALVRLPGASDALKTRLRTELQDLLVDIVVE